MQVTDQKPKLIANRWIAPDGHVLQSKHRHDCVFYTCSKTGETFMLDGGIGYYIRLSGNLKDACVYSNDPHELKRNAFMWCSYSIDGNSPATWMTPAEMTTEHIWSILKTQRENLLEHVYDMFLDEIKFRKG